MVDAGPQRQHGAQVRVARDLAGRRLRGDHVAHVRRVEPFRLRRLVPDLEVEIGVPALDLLRPDGGVLGAADQ
jgi:hypothetical protein